MSFMEKLKQLCGKQDKKSNLTYKEIARQMVREDAESKEQLDQNNNNE